MTPLRPSPSRPAATIVARAVRVAARVGLAALAVLTPPAAYAASATTAEQRAQILPQLPPDAAGRIEQRLREAPTPALPGAAPSIQVEPQPIEQAPDSAANIPLKIESLKLVGATVYSTEELEQYWRDRIGKPGTLGDLFAIASEITARYRNDGYVLSRAIVPAQEIEDGKVELRVIEGYVDRVIFEGDDTRPGLLRATGEKIRNSRPIRVSDLERYLLLLGDQPGANVTSVLKPSEAQTGAADLIITMEREDAQYFTTLDNRGTRYVGPVQYTAGTRLNSLFGLGDQTFVRAITTPFYANELMAFDLNNLQTLDEEGTTLGLQMNFAEAHPGFTLQPLNLVSDAATVGLVLTRPVIRSRLESLRFNLNFAINDYKTEANPNKAGVFPVLHDSIRSVRVSAVWDTIDQWRGVNSVGLQFSQGLDILGATRSGFDNLSRSVGRSDYSKLNLDASRLQSLVGNWSFLFAITAQRAFTPLLASEQFGLGGSQFLRAYDPSDIVGDSGIGAKFELQYGEQPKLPYLQDFTTYTYFDIGRTQNTISSQGEKSSDAGISIGVGTRFTLTEWANGYIEVSQPIMRGVVTEDTNVPPHNHQPRIFFALIAKF